MQIAGRFRVVRHKDRFAPTAPSKRLSKQGSPLDVRVLPWSKGHKPLLLVAVQRRMGNAVERNRFRRRVRMAFLSALRKCVNIPDAGFVLWVRPARDQKMGCRIEYKDIEEQIEQSLCSLRRP